MAINKNFNFLYKKNNFYANKASIGGIFYLSGFSSEFLLNFKTKISIIK